MGSESRGAGPTAQTPGRASRDRGGCRGLGRWAGGGGRGVQMAGGGLKGALGDRRAQRVQPALVKLHNISIANRNAETLAGLKAWRSLASRHEPARARAPPG